MHRRKVHKDTLISIDAKKWWNRGKHFGRVIRQLGIKPDIFFRGAKFILHIRPFIISLFSLIWRCYKQRLHKTLIIVSLARHPHKIRVILAELRGIRLNLLKRLPQVIVKLGLLRLLYVDIFLLGSWDPARLPRKVSLHRIQLLRLLLAAIAELSKGKI